MSVEEMLAVTQLYSIAGCLDNETAYLNQRPFRSPHHSASTASLVGGGRLPRPGEISLAHHGVLYLDELPEFSRTVLEALRQPLEDKTVTVARVEQSVTYPADCTFVGSLNPCPCGFYGDEAKECNCTPIQISKYQNKLSGPFLDRMDLFCYVPRVTFSTLADSKNKEESSRAIQRRVQQAIDKQNQRYAEYEFSTNSHIPAQLMDKFCFLDKTSKNLMKQAMQTMNLSPRSYHRILRVARTIANLNKTEKITTRHLSEALQYRRTLTSF